MPPTDKHIQTPHQLYTGHQYIMTFPIVNETEALKHRAWDRESADVHKHGHFTHIVDRRTVVTELLFIFSLCLSWSFGRPSSL